MTLEIILLSIDRWFEVIVFSYRNYECNYKYNTFFFYVVDILIWGIWRSCMSVLACPFVVKDCTFLVPNRKRILYIKVCF